MKNLYHMSIDIKKPKKVLIANQSSVLFKSLGTKSTPTEVAPVFAEVVEVVEVIDEPVADEVVVEDFLSIDDLKVSELKKILDSKEIEYTATKKSDLIELVKANS